MSLRVTLPTQPWVLDDPVYANMPTSAVGGPMPIASRIGRLRQRYGETGQRLVAGCVPVRIRGAGLDPSDVEVLLISKGKGVGWVFPKGGWEDDETVEAAALRETVEEAGVRGMLEEPMLGSFMFHCSKQPTSLDGGQYTCLAHMFVLHVAEELEVWPEPERKRVWVPLADASGMCLHHWMRDALHLWIRRRGWSHILEGNNTFASGNF